MKKRSKERLLLLIGIWVLSSLPGLTQQKIGSPFLRNYPTKIYQGAPQNWNIVQDARGLMYFANDKGILEYDGKNWSLIPVNNQSAVRSLCVSKEGIIYVGASNEFGYLAPDSLGSMHYYSLLGYIEENLREFGDVWSCHATEEGIYFHTDNTLFRFQYKSAIPRFQTWQASPGAYFFLSYYVNRKLYILDAGIGLMQLDGGKLHLLKEGKKFIGKKIYTILPYTTQKILIGVRSEGFYVLDQQTQTLEKFKTEADDYIVQHQIYYARVLSNSDLLVCTRNRGIVVMDKKGKIIETIGKEQGLQNENVHYAFEDRSGMIWLALDNGISQINLHVPIRFWDAGNELNGTIKSIIEYKHTTYVATTLGVFYLKDYYFKKVPGIGTQCWSLLKFQVAEEQEQLLVGTNEGIYEIKNNQARLLRNTGDLEVLKLYQSPINPLRVYAGLKGGLLSMRFQKENTTWKDEGIVSNIKDEIYSIAEDKEGNLWLGTFIRGVVKVSFDNKHYPVKIKHYTQKEGLPSLRDVHVCEGNKGILLATQKGLYEYRKHTRKFVLTNKIKGEFAQGKRGVYTWTKDKQGNWWMADASNQKFPIGVAKKQPGKEVYQWHDKVLRRLPVFDEPVIYPNEDGEIWIGGTEGLFMYDTRQKIRKKHHYVITVRKVIVNEDSLIFLGTNNTKKQSSDFWAETSLLQTKEPKFRFHPGFSIEFEYTASFFDLEEQLKYSYYLESNQDNWFSWFQGKSSEKEWSVWTQKTKKQYTNLKEGNYIFYVRARNIYGEESKITSYKFKILPPWYRTAQAQGGYVILAIFTLFAGVRGYTMRLRQQKRRLEQIVSQRTQEIQQQNVELEKQQLEIQVQATHLKEANEEITRKNEDITASINYACRIQEAMLPRLEKIKKAFPNSFVLYRPRDIVSGDFYWFVETIMEPKFAKDPGLKGKPSIFKGFAGGKKIISAVDCTGHGVPGAFMSMVGDAYLNQIINLEGITQPHLILKELDRNVKKALKQEETANMDGMDMAVCVIDPNNRVLEFSGAKNPLIYIQNGELHHIKGDKEGIGGLIFDENKEKEFTRHVIPIHKPISFYIFSDGFQDQFGGKKGRKFMLKRMKKILIENVDKPMQEQKKILENALDNWMEGYGQIDDILLIGVKINPEDLKAFAFN